MHRFLIVLFAFGAWSAQAQIKPKPIGAKSDYAYCCNIHSGNIVPASATGCNNGQALVPVNTQQECTRLYCLQHPEKCVSPTPNPTATPRPSPTATPRPSPTATPRPSPTATPRPSPTATPRPSPTATPAPSPIISCASSTAGYITALNSSNNVPLYQCFRPSTAPVECLYRYAPPVLGTSWNAGCPANVAGDNCCEWPTPAPSPSPTATPNSGLSGKCCKPKANTNPQYDCASLEVLPAGLTLDQYDFYNRCQQVNYGASCFWDITNVECCSPGIKGCGSTAGTYCKSPFVSIPFPFESIATNPAYSEQYKLCKTNAGLSTIPSNYYCCVKLD